MTQQTTHPLEAHDDRMSPSVVPFVLFHVATIGIFFTGFTTEAVIMCAVLYVVRVFGITAGYHRLLSHRAYKAGRITQFIIVMLGTMAMQRGPLWWAAKHREHHRDSDYVEDAHSPRHYGFWGAHCGWIFRPRRHADMSLIEDFAQYPELRWLDKHKYLPGITLGLACFLIGGWSGLFVGFVLSTMLVYHATFMINSLAHVFGSQRYLTGDDSRNNWLLAILALGEGWHNNHHYYPGSARNGFFWWEYDVTYYVIKMLSWFGLTWDIKVPPQSVLENTKTPSSKIIDKTAGHIASDYPAEAITQRVRESLQNTLHIEELGKRTKLAMSEVEAYLHSIELPELPSVEEIKASASKIFANVPSLDVAASRAHALLVRDVSKRLVADLQQQPRAA